MVRITGSIGIDASPELVFDTAADSRNEPSYNPGMVSAELLTPEPIGVGTKFRAVMGKSSRNAMIVELTGYDRPHRIQSQTRSTMMETSGALTFTPERGATLMAWDWDVRPKGWYRIFSPLLGWLGRRREFDIWSGLKRRLEGVGESH